MRPKVATFQSNRLRLVIAGLLACLALGLLVVAAVSALDQGSDVEAADVFPALNRPVTSSDALSDMSGIKKARLLGESETARYHIAEHEDGAVCLILSESVQGVRGEACALPGSVMQDGLLFQHSGSDSTHYVAIALPEGYDRVLDGNGTVVSEVRGQLATFNYKRGTGPDTVIAEGPVGKLEFSVPKPRAPSSP